MESVGNNELLARRKTGFLCASQAKSGDVVRCISWAMELPQDACVVGGFQTSLELDVLHLLLKRRIAVVVLLARRMYRVMPDHLQAAIDAGCAIVVSTSTASRTTKAAAYERNEQVAAMSDNLVFGSLSPDSSLYAIYTKYKDLKPTTVVGVYKDQLKP